jgi:translation initiation factor IF-1
MSQGPKFVVEGYVTEELPGTKFKVKITVAGEEHEIIAYLSGKMRMNYIKILEGDYVKVEMTPYDLTQGRIIYREKVKSSGGPDVSDSLVNKESVIEPKNEG